ncbi:hypothetical protein NC651_039711 [Populus alba x Populus x berolinensis]|nr:hypothetical protein NC651_039711 [Populus alba x Populus x berolinensis]
MDCPSLEQTSINEVPQSVNRKLKRLYLSGCSKITEFPENLEYIEELNLSGTAIKEVPSSIQFLTRLRTLNMSGCSKLENFPEITVPMESLQYFDLSKTGIKEIPSSFKNLECLMLMDCPSLEQTSINEVPQSVNRKLKRLYLSGCSKITEFPENLEYIEELNLSGTAIKEVPSSIQFLTRLRILNMSGCSKLENFPEITVPIESLQYLDLSKTGIKEIPSSFKDMISLITLELYRTPIGELPLSIKDMVCLSILTLNGTPIKALPELPPSMWFLTTDDCASLETVNIDRFWYLMDFTNCFKLDQKPLIAAMHLKIQSGEEIRQTRQGAIRMVLPGSEIPEWFGEKGIGSSITIPLPSNCHHLKGIAFCLVFLFSLASLDMLHESNGSSAIYFDYHVKSKNGEHDGDEEVVFASRETRYALYSLMPSDSDHMILHYELDLVIIYVNILAMNKHGRKVGYEIRRPFKLKSWGVYLHFDENLRADKKFRRKFRRYKRN